MQNNEPIYMCMRKYLIEIIEKNKHIDGFKLPSENQLAKRFGASRITAKNAILSLKKDKLIYRMQGKGTFISPEVKNKSLNIEKEERSIVGFIVPGIQGRFIGKIVEGIEAYLKEREIDLMILSTRWDLAVEEKMIKMAIGNKCKGLIILPVTTTAINNQILTLGLNFFPTVLVDRHFPELDISYVACDHYTAAYNGTKYLLQQGHQYIGFIAQDPDMASSVQERILGYKYALEEMQLEVKEDYLLIGEHNEESFEKKLEHYINTHPNMTAIITTSTGYGRKVIREIQKRNLRIPEDITLMFFDNEFEEYADLLTVKPIIIDQNPYEIGRNAAKVLYRLLYQNPKPKKVLLKEEILQVE